MLHDMIARARAEGRSALDEAGSKTLLAAFGIRVPRSLVVAGAISKRRRGRRTHSALRRESRFARHPAQIGRRRRHAQSQGRERRSRKRSRRWRKKPGIAGKPVEGWLIEEMIPRRPRDGDRRSSTIPNSAP